MSNTEQITTISIHAPREGGDAIGCLMALVISIFQSTPPARGATTKPPKSLLKLLFQSTPPARGATKRISRVLQPDKISIHAPREGGDSKL